MSYVMIEADKPRRHEVEQAIRLLEKGPYDKTVGRPMMVAENFPPQRWSLAAVLRDSVPGVMRHHETRKLVVNRLPMEFAPKQIIGYEEGTLDYMTSLYNWEREHGTKDGAIALLKEVLADFT